MQGTPELRQCMGEQARIAEFVHAWLKSQLGLRRFHVRGLGGDGGGSAAPTAYRPPLNVMDPGVLVSLGIEAPVALGALEQLAGHHRAVDAGVLRNLPCGGLDCPPSELMRQNGGTLRVVRRGWIPR